MLVMKFTVNTSCTYFSPKFKKNQATPSQLYHPEALIFQLPLTLLGLI